MTTNQMNGARPDQRGTRQLRVGAEPRLVDVADQRVMIRATTAAVTRLATSWTITARSHG